MENPHIWQWSPLRFCTTCRLQSHSTLEGVFSRFTLSVFLPSLSNEIRIQLHARAQKHAHINTHQSGFHLSSIPFSSILPFPFVSLTFSLQHRLWSELQWYCSGVHLEKVFTWRGVYYPPPKKSSGTAALTRNRLGYNRKGHTRMQTVHPVVPFTCIRLSYCV